MNKKTRAISIAAVMAILGTVVLVLFVRSAEDRALSGEELVSVLVTTAPVPAGTDASQMDSLVTSEQVPAKIAPPGVVSDLVTLAGQVTSVDLLEGETLLAGRFVAADQYSPSGGSVDVPDGMLEVTVAMSQEQFVGGIPVPGDHVALVATGMRSDFIPFAEDPIQQAAVSTDPNAPAAALVDPASLRITKIILQQALVTNVQGNPLPEATAAQSATERVAPADGSLLVTLALSGPDTERLLYVRNDQSLNAALHMALHTGDALVTSEGISVENVIDPEAPVG